MTTRRLINEIENVLRTLHNVRIVYFPNAVVEKRLDQHTMRVTWSSWTPGYLFREETTINNYQNWIKSSAYSALLYDGSFIQFSYDLRRAEMVDHRLVYYPCPFNLDTNMLDELGIIETVQHHVEQPIVDVRLSSPIRFDYDIDNKAVGHPASHLTIVSLGCRIPVYGPISPGRFIKFVLMNFYPRQWEAVHELRDIPEYSLGRTLNRNEETKLHFNIREVVSNPEIL